MNNFDGHFKVKFYYKSFGVWTLIMPIFFFWKCRLHIMSATYIQMCSTENTFSLEAIMMNPERTAP